MEEDADVVEHFHGVYLLYCMNPKYRGKTYIGYTVDPCRRLEQHNAGKEHKGAWKTSNKGPWSMVLIVHGFPNNIAALRFEWAWQHPHISRRLKHVPRKKSQQKMFDFCLSVLSEMLKRGPWCRLPLTIRWLDYEFFCEYSANISAPMHMPMCYGKVISQKIQRTDIATLQTDKSLLLCSICSTVLEENQSVSCIKPSCSSIAHLSCLARLFTEDSMILPVQGVCPDCKTNVLWGDLIRKKIGCYGNLRDIPSTDYA